MKPFHFVESDFLSLPFSRRGNSVVQYGVHQKCQKRNESKNLKNRKRVQLGTKDYEIEFVNESLELSLRKA